MDPSPQGLLGVQLGCAEKAAADHVSHKARCHFETIKTSNIFGDTGAAVSQGLLRAATLNDEKPMDKIGIDCYLIPP